VDREKSNVLQGDRLSSKLRSNENSGAPCRECVELDWMYKRLRIGQVLHRLHEAHLVLVLLGSSVGLLTLVICTKRRKSGTYRLLLPFSPYLHYESGASHRPPAGNRWCTNYHPLSWAEHSHL